MFLILQRRTILALTGPGARNDPSAWPVSR